MGDWLQEVRCTLRLGREAAVSLKVIGQVTRKPPRGQLIPSIPAAIYPAIRKDLGEVRCGQNMADKEGNCLSRCIRNWEGKHESVLWEQSRPGTPMPISCGEQAGQKI
jgi:hypothetical protein